MKYPYDVKVGSVWYEAGTEIPDVEEEVKAEEPIVVEEPQKRITKSDILGMRKADLIKLAKENGISEADEMTGSELKSALVKALNL